ncbi:hypothetical protein SLE2022_140800 [Rubroshorea leprosula]
MELKSGEQRRPPTAPPGTVASSRPHPHRKPHNSCNPVSTSTPACSFLSLASLSVYDETLEETQDYSSHPFRRAGLLEYVLQGNLRANSTDLQPGFGHAMWHPENIELETQIFIFTELSQI